MDHHDADKICAVCGVPNDQSSQYCVNCNSFLPERNSAISEQDDKTSQSSVRYIHDYVPKTLKNLNQNAAEEKSVRHVAAKKFIPIMILFIILYGITSHFSSPIISTPKPVPAITYNSGEKASKDFEWKYDGKTFNWHVEMSKELLEYDRNINTQFDTFFQASGYTQKMMYDSSSVDFKRMVQTLSANGKQDYNVWVKDEMNEEWVSSLAQQLDQSAAANGYDHFQRAEFILSFVGSAIPYETTRYPQLAAQTVFDNGDCEDKSILLAGLLNHLGYQVAMLYFTGTSTDPGHMAVGIAFTDELVPSRKGLSYYEYNGHKYYFAETTTANWPLGKASVEKPADVFEIDSPQE